jgi:hypothetical protein
MDIVGIEGSPDLALIFLSSFCYHLFLFLAHNSTLISDSQPGIPLQQFQQPVSSPSSPRMFTINRIASSTQRFFMGLST